MRPRAPVARCCRLACASPSPCSTSRERSGPGRRRPAFLSPRRWTSEMRSAPVQHRGIALILVLTTIAILAAIGVDFSYSSRVSLKLAENLRDETRAEYLAKSAVNLSRLLLHFQKQVDQLGGQLTQGIQQLMGATANRPPATAAPATAATAAPSSNLGIRLWELVHISSNAFGMLLAGNIEGMDKAPLPPGE